MDSEIKTVLQQLSCVVVATVLQDERLPALSQLMRRLDPHTLTTLYLVDCRVQLDDDALSALTLRTLVLSHTHLRSLPTAVFNMASLEVLKVDRNCLAEVPADIARLSTLRTFACDSQRPRLRALPVAALSRLSRLEVLSFGNNRVADVAWIPAALPRLRVLRCDRNGVARLPASLGDLRQLTTLDVAHNRLERIPAQLAPLVRRLYRFDFFNLTLRPRHVRRSRAQLLAHLDLENFLQSLSGASSTLSALPQPIGGGPVSGPSAAVQRVPAGHVGRDVTLALVGETNAGKAALVAALRDDHGISRLADVPSSSSSSSSSRSSHHAPPPTFEVHQFNMRPAAAASSDVSGPCHVCALVLANDVLDTFSQQVDSPPTCYCPSLDGLYCVHPSFFSL